MAQFLELIPIAKAQTLDAVAQPTFGNIEVTGGGGTSASVLISSSKTSVVVGERFTVKVEIKTNTIAVKEFRVVLEFDPAKLTVVDADSAVPGTQVKLLDNVFITEDPPEDNIVSNGRVVLVAKTQSGNAFNINKQIVEVEFQAQSSGSTAIKVAQGTNGTQLIRSNGSGLTYTKNEITIQTNTAQSSTNTPNQNQNPNTPGNNNTNTGTNTSTSNPNVTVIPATSISDNAQASASLIIGLLFVATGISIVKKKFRKKNFD